MRGTVDVLTGQDIPLLHAKILAGRSLCGVVAHALCCVYNERTSPQGNERARRHSLKRRDTPMVLSRA